MEKKHFKQLLQLATYAIILYLALSNISIVLGALLYVLNLLNPLIWGIAIAFVLNILLRTYEDVLLKGLWGKHKLLKKSKRALCIVLTFVTVILFFSLLITFIVPQLAASISSLASSLPSYLTRLSASIYAFAKDFGFSLNLADHLPQNLEQLFLTVQSLASTTLPKIFDMTIGITSGVFNIFLGIIFSIYLLFSKEKLCSMIKKMLVAYAPRNVSNYLLYVGHEANVTFSKFIGGQLTEAVILGSLCTIGLVILKMPYAPLIGVMIGVTSLIPILGAYLGLIPSAFILFMEDPMYAFWFIIFLICLQQFEGNVIYPRVVGGAIGLSGFWVLVAIVIGGGLMGILGMLLGVPTLAVIYTVIRKDTYRRLDQLK